MEGLYYNGKEIESNVSNTTVEHKRMYEFVKRVIDIVVSLIGGVLLSPLFIILAILIKIDYITQAGKALCKRFLRK